MTVLAADGLTVRRGVREIVSNLSVALTSGSFVAVIGANGAGKSSLLSVLAGLTKADAGRITLDGVALASLSPRALARRRAYLPQSPRCEWPISVERLVALGLTPVLPAFGGLGADMTARIGAVLRAVDLADRGDQPTDTLSGGELARAMLARALVADPAILLADEPLTGLDPRHALDGARRLSGLAAEGRLVVAAMHDLTLAARCASHILALRDGRLVAFGPTSEVLTPSLLEQVFDVPALVRGAGEETVVDFPMGRPA